jgi:hypothetical protein
MATRTTRPAKRRAPAIPYPDLPPTPYAAGTPRAIFWRAAWLRDEAQAHALDAHWTHVRSTKAHANEPLMHALCVGLSKLQDEARVSLKTLIDAGGLLYAWIPEGGAT